MFLVAELRRVDGTSVGVIVLGRHRFTAPRDPAGRQGWRGEGVVVVEGIAHHLRIAAIAIDEPVLAEAAGGPG